MSDTDPIVILGSGLAGYSTARELRKLDKATPLVIITGDDGWFYSKPMISNALGREQVPMDLPTASAEKMAGDVDARILTRTQVSAIDTTAREVLAGDEHLRYRDLVLALGAQPLRPPLAGDAAGRVLSVNDLDDYVRFRQALAGHTRVAVLGAGLIGSEFANDLVASGHQVTVIEPFGHALGRLLPEAVGRAVQRALEAKGVVFHFGTTCERVDAAEHALQLTLASGERVHAEVVLSAVGLAPRTQLAEAAGIECGRGIVVDRRLRTSDAHVYALGDCMEVQGVVLPFIMPIMHAARALAQVLTGNDVELRYPAMPVVVKTPAHPVVVAPPPLGTSGEWQVEETDNGVRALHVGPDGTRLGFALSGGHVSERAALAKEMPPVLA